MLANRTHFNFLNLIKFRKKIKGPIKQAAVVVISKKVGKRRKALSGEDSS